VPDSGREVGMGVMLVGIGFLSVLTATVAFKEERGDEHEEILGRLQRTGDELIEVRSRVSH
jgi:hypothetical protein